MDTDPCKSLADRAVKPCLERWGLADELKAVRVRYDRGGKDEEVVRRILSDAAVREALGMPSVEDDAAVRVERLEVTATSLSLLDPIGASDVMLASGRARQCQQVEVGGVECDSELRKWLARRKLERDVAHGAINEEERDLDEARLSVDFSNQADRELLYRLFEVLALGGPLAQPDFELEPYLVCTKALYRDAVQVYKRSSDGVTCLANGAYEAAGPLVFGGDLRPLARCFVITEPKRAKALVLFSPARGMW